MTESHEADRGRDLRGQSTEDTHGSIPTQIEDCRALAEREGWEVVGVFQDEGFSAFSGNRGPDLEKAKALATTSAVERGRCAASGRRPVRPRGR